MANGPFGDGPMSLWYHINCFAELKNNSRSNVKDLQSSNEIANFDLQSIEDQKVIISKLNITKDAPIAPSTSKIAIPKKMPVHDDDLFQNFVILVQKVADESSYNNKSAIIKQFITKGTSKQGFGGNIETWLTLLMPTIDKRVYNLKDKQIVKLFSRIFALKHEELLDDLHNGDVSETISKFFSRSQNVTPVQESDLTVFDVNSLLDDLNTTGVEDTQARMLESICSRCTQMTLRTIIRLIKRDLKMNCRERHVLDAVHDDAYDAFQKSRDLKIILIQFCGSSGGASASKSKSSGLNVMTAVSPMLAEACKDFDRALSKCPKGFYSEIKYDGERVQIHKQGHEFKFFSRNLKAVQEHKIAQLKTYLPKAFPTANELILDSEIIMVDKTTGSLLAFGTLGKHKKEENQNAVPCLFIFDCLQFNGDDLTSKSLKERKKFLEATLKPIKFHVELSEYRLLTKKNELVDMTKEVLRKGLEGKIKLVK
jgi:DNA ligase-3